MADKLFCADEGCEWTSEEWTRLADLSRLPPPPADPSNMYADLEAAVSLGHRLYFETKLSGRATLQDTLGRPVQHARAPKGQPINVSCATCHDPGLAGGDNSSSPSHISVGAGWYDVNGQQTLNAAHYPLLYWNGRSDSLWSQAAAVMESTVSMNGDRVAIAWTMIDHYAKAYATLFPQHPLPTPPVTSAVLKANLLDPDSEVGPCKGTAPDCPAGCESVSTAGKLACWPIFPLHGRPGRRGSGCERGDTTQAFQDAYDCLGADVKEQVTRVLVNVAKAIAAYERKLVSDNSPFDRFVAEGPSSTAISEDARRGARLFVGKASCIDCHSGPLLSDKDFHNIGIPQTGVGVPTVAECRIPGFCDCDNSDKCLPWGYEDGLSRLNERLPTDTDRPTAFAYRRSGKYSDNENAAAGTGWQETHKRYYDLVPDKTRRGSWRTPSLRDVAVTGPYMHNGVYRTLEEVVWHYDQGGEYAEGDGRKAPELKPLFLTARERSDLVAFLRTLTGVKPINLKTDWYVKPDAMAEPPEGTTQTPTAAAPAAGGRP